MLLENYVFLGIQGRQPFVGESLALAEASKEDGGTYTCVADNGAGDATSRQFNVNVQCMYPQNY